MNAVAALARCIFWFNPLVHFAARVFRLDQELACDAQVIERFPACRRVYADALIKTHAHGPALPVGCHWRGGHALVQRVRHLARPTPRRVWRGAGVALSAILALGVSLAAWATQAGGTAGAGLDSNEWVEAHIELRPQVDDGLRATELRGSGALVVDDDPKKAVFPRLIERAGAPFSIAMGDGEERWMIEARARPRSDGDIDVSYVVTHGRVEHKRGSSMLREGVPLHLRMPPVDGHVGVSAAITLWRSDGPGMPHVERVPQARVQGKVQIRQGTHADASFFDVAAPMQTAEFVPNFNPDLRLEYRVDQLDDTKAMVYANVTQVSEAYEIKVLANPTLMMTRGEDAAIRIGMAEVAAAKTSLLGLAPTTIDRGATTSVTLGGDTWNPGDIELIFTLDAP